MGIKVPIYDAPQVAPQGAQGGRLDMSLANTGAEQVGQAMQHAAGMTAQLVGQEVAKMDKLRIDMLNNQSNEEAQAAIRAMTNRTGEAAITGPNGELPYAADKARWDANTAAMVEKASSPRQKEAVKAYRDQLSVHIEGVLGQHVDKEVKNLSVDTNINKHVLGLKAIAGAAGSEKVFAATLADLHESDANTAAIMGNTAKLDAIKAETLSKARTTQVLTLLNDPDQQNIKLAKQLMKDNPNDIIGDHRSQIDIAVANAVSGGDIQRIVALGRAEPDPEKRDEIYRKATDGDKKLLDSVRDEDVHRERARDAKLAKVGGELLLHLGKGDMSQQDLVTSFINNPELDAGTKQKYVEHIKTWFRGIAMENRQAAALARGEAREAKAEAQTAVLATVLMNQSWLVKSTPDQLLEMMDKGSISPSGLMHLQAAREHLQSQPPATVKIDENVFNKVAFDGGLITKDGKPVGKHKDTLVAAKVAIQDQMRVEMEQANGKQLTPERRKQIIERNLLPQTGTVERTGFLEGAWLPGRDRFKADTMPGYMLTDEQIRSAIPSAELVKTRQWLLYPPKGGVGLTGLQLGTLSDRDLIEAHARWKKEVGK